MSETPHPTMHHFESTAAYDSFVEEFAIIEASAIQEWGAYEVASDVVAFVDDRSAEIEVGGGSVPNVSGVDAPLCPVTVLDYSQKQSGLPREEVEHITHLAVELLEQDLQEHVEVS